MIRTKTIPDPGPDASPPAIAAPGKAGSERKKTPAVITPAQMRAGRALLGWSQQQLADAAKIGLASVNNYERGASDPRLSTLRDARDAMAEAGVIFIEPTNAEGEGCKLAKPSSKKKGAAPARPDADDAASK